MLKFCYEAYNPTKASKIKNTALIYHQKSFLVFGGYTGSDSNVIAKFSMLSLKWTKIGNLNTARRGLSVALLNDRFIVIGGAGTQKTEVCMYWHELIVCKSLEHQLTDYTAYPEIFMVDSEFGKNAGQC